MDLKHFLIFDSRLFQEFRLNRQAPDFYGTKIQIQILRFVRTRFHIRISSDAFAIHVFWKTGGKGMGFFSSKKKYYQTTYSLLRICLPVKYKIVPGNLIEACQFVYVLKI